MPVTLIFVLGAAALSYQLIVERSVRLENQILESRSSELVASYKKYSSFAESYLYAVVSSRRFESFISVEDSGDRYSIELRSALGKDFSDFNKYQSNVSALSIKTFEQGAKGLRSLLYIENSINPNLTISESIDLQNGRLLFQTSETRETRVVTSSHSRFLILETRLLDKTTFLEPIPSRISQSVSVQFAIEPTEFISLLERLEKDYGARVSIVASPQSIMEAKHRLIDLGDGNSLLIEIYDEFYEESLKEFGASFFSFTAIYIGFFILILIALIRYYITDPISQLTNKVRQLDQGVAESPDFDHYDCLEIDLLSSSIAGTYEKLTKSYQYVKELNEMDPLTGLHNLSFLTNRGYEILLNSQNKTLYTVYIDLDNFKFVNDFYGHEVGNQILKTFSTKFKDVVQSESLGGSVYTARLGGDEFCIFIAEDCLVGTVETLCQSVLNICSEGLKVDDVNYPVTASIGYAKYPDNGETLTELISAADSAMFRAKSQGKNQYAEYDIETQATCVRVRRIEAVLADCDFDRELSLEFMPIISVKERSICGVEALIRWHSSELGIVSPEEFIPVAESCGLFIKIDRWVINKALEEYSHLSHILGRDVQISINLSAAQLNINRLTEYIVHKAELHCVPSSSINFEITETFCSTFTDQGQEFLDNLTWSGFSLSIDDFGTGYSSLLQLLEYPAKTIKFDKVFLDHALSEQHVTILGPLVDLCHAKGLTVTIEGIENQEQADFLASIQCDYLQGYFFSPALSVKELAYKKNEILLKVSELSTGSEAYLGG